VSTSPLSPPLLERRGGGLWKKGFTLLKLPLIYLFCPAAHFINAQTAIITIMIITIMAIIIIGETIISLPPAGYGLFLLSLKGCLRGAKPLFLSIPLPLIEGEGDTEDRVTTKWGRSPHKNHYIHSC
jgi:hypothetical protein